MTGLRDVTVVTPTIAPRAHLLSDMLASVELQTAPPRELIIEEDRDREGAGITRTRALSRVTTDWVTFMDDDDWMGPEHLEKLWLFAADTGADYVYSWYTVVGGSDPRPEEADLPWDPEHPRQTTIVTMVRTELAQSVGFVHPDETEAGLKSMDRHYHGEDAYFTMGCWEAGAHIEHLCERTWFWRHHGNNTSGLPTRW